MKGVVGYGKLCFLVRLYVELARGSQVGGQFSVSLHCAFGKLTSCFEHVQTYFLYSCSLNDRESNCLYIVAGVFLSCQVSQLLQLQINTQKLILIVKLVADG